MKNNKIMIYLKRISRKLINISKIKRKKIQKLEDKN